MDSSVCVSGFLLLIFSTAVHLSLHPEPILKVVGGSAEFRPRSPRVDECVLYRVGGDGDLLLLVNCSQPESPQPDGYEVKCVNSDYFYFEMSKLTMSHSGDYRAEGWRGGKINKHTSYRLTVCAEGSEKEEETVFDDDSAVLCRVDSTLGNGSSLQVHRSNIPKRESLLVLDTHSSLEPLVEDLRGRLQVDLNTSLVTLTGVTELDRRFYCTVWREAQCQSLKERRLFLPRYFFGHEGENATLPCILKGRPDMEWDTPTGRVQFKTAHQQEVTYRNQTGNYSLFISSVSQHHSGRYLCISTDRVIRPFYFYVCPKVSPLDVMFSQGESIPLKYTPHLNFSAVNGIQWYRQKVLEPQVLFLHSRKFSVPLPEDLRDRVTWRGKPTDINSTLIISNLTAEDSGLYTWRVYGKNNSRNIICSEGTYRFVYLDPLGVHSPFYRAYAPLIGCGLLGLVAAVIWLKLRSRRGEQTSGCRSREGQQSGDEDLYDEVEMAELNTPPSAESDGAVEHSV